MTHYVYKRTDKYKYNSRTIYARVVLDGDFIEVEFGYGFRGDTHKDS